MQIFKNMHIVGDGPQREHFYSSRFSLVSWKPILAGFLVTLVAYATFGALGMVFGGVAASNVESQTAIKGLAAGAALWVILSVVFSLLAGSYFAGRTSTFITGRIGAAQGLTIAALFFVTMIYGMGQTVEVAGKGLGSVVSVIGMNATNLAGQPVIQNTVEKSLANLPLKSDPTTVVQGLATRLLSGSTDSAKTYLAYQTGLTETEVNARIGVLQAELKSQVKEVSDQIAKAVAAAGGVMFLVLILGMGAAILGGAMGSRVNFNQPLTDEAGPEITTGHAI